MNRGNTAWKAANLVETQPRVVVPGSRQTWSAVVEIAKGVFLHLVSSLRLAPRDTKNPPSTCGSDSKILGFYSHICAVGTKTYVYIQYTCIYLWPTNENRRENDVCVCVCKCMRVHIFILYTNSKKRVKKSIFMISVKFLILFLFHFHSPVGDNGGMRSSSSNTSSASRFPSTKHNICKWNMKYMKIYMLRLLLVRKYYFTILQTCRSFQRDKAIRYANMLCERKTSENSHT